MKLHSTMILAAVLMATLGCGGYGGPNAMAAPAPTPQITPPGGTYNTPQSVTISDSMNGAVIYFTTDGTTPSLSSPRFTGPIPVTHSMTVQAIAVVSGYQTSAVAAATFVIAVRML